MCPPPTAGFRVFRDPTIPTSKKEGWRATFVRALGQNGNVSSACRVAGIHRSTAYELRETDDEFAKAWDDALETACDDLELEARRRAVVGVDRPVFYRGGECGHVREYSDTLLIFLLKAHRPAKYRENVRVEHDGLPAAIEVRLSFDPSAGEAGS